MDRGGVGFTKAGLLYIYNGKGEQAGASRDRERNEFTSFFTEKRLQPSNLLFYLLLYFLNLLLHPPIELPHPHIS